MRFFEEYACGCTTPQASKKNLVGYCAIHGREGKHVYRADGLPADERTAARRKELSDVIESRKPVVKAVTK